MEYYGWLGKLKVKHINKGVATKTSDIIKEHAIKCGAELVVGGEFRSKNLMCKDNNYYYILSIGENYNAWAPYSSVVANERNKNNITLILTRDTGEDTGELWDVDLEDISNELKPVEGHSYYWLTLNNLEGNTNVKHYKYSLTDENDENYIKNVLDEIIK